jgi:hypothetical protein
MCNKDMEICSMGMDMLHGHGHAAWQRACFMNYLQHRREHFA